MRIVITNVVALNGGDAAILYGIMELLGAAFDNAEFHIIDDNAAVSQRLYSKLKFLQRGIPRSEWRLWRAIRRKIGPEVVRFLARNPAYLENRAAYRDADLIVSTGGTYLVENYDLTERFIQLHLALASGKPLVMFTQSLGPFRKAVNGRWARLIFPHVNRIMLRDELSQKHLKAVGVPLDSSSVVPDAAFALVETAEASITSTADDRLRVAVSVRDWNFPEGTGSNEKYWAGMVAMVTKLVRDNNATCTFISTCQGVPEYSKDDSRVARMILARLPEDCIGSVSVDDTYHSPPELMNRLTDFDLVVATRMHMAILSMCVGLPVLGIAYEFKTRELFAKLGLADWVIDITDVTPETLPQLVARLIVAALPTRATVRAASSNESTRLKALSWQALAAIPEREV